MLKEIGHQKNYQTIDKSPLTDEELNFKDIYRQISNLFMIKDGKPGPDGKTNLFGTPVTLVLNMFMFMFIASRQRR